MKRTFLFLAGAAAVMSLASCCNNRCKNAESEESVAKTVVVEAHDNCPKYEYVLNPQFDITQLEKDEDGYYILFNGKDLTGWRGYLSDHVPELWTIEDGCIKFNGDKEGEGGELIFSKMFKNFDFKFEWKVEKGSNSGVFYLGREIMRYKQTEENGSMVENKKGEYLFASAPEYQILDNENHGDALQGSVVGIRKSASLYDMIVPEPQNAKPYGEWNTGGIMVYQGTVVHSQNDVNVLEYHLWTPEWTDLLNSSKFSKEDWPLAFELLNNCGGPEHEGYLGFQDHGDTVYFRNVRVKILD